MGEIAELKARVAERPDDAWLLLCLGARQLEEGALEASRAALEEASRLEPTVRGEAACLLARIEVLQGCFHEARRRLVDALRLLPPGCDLRDEAQAQLLDVSMATDVALAAPARRTFKHDFEPLVGRSRALHGALRQLDGLIPGRLAIVLVGEPGTGRTLAADAIRRGGPRPYRGRLLRLDCTASSPAVSEQALFGLARGARSGGGCASPGLLDQANGATLLLENVDGLGPAGQARLSRFLSRGVYHRTGGHRERRVDCRVVVTTEDWANGLDSELSGQLSRRRVCLPPLRERRGDIALLVDRFWEGPELPGGVMSALVRQRWPGNVAQLRAVLRWLASSPGVSVEAVERFHHRTTEAGVEDGRSRPQTADARALSWVTPQVARLHRICPLRLEGPTLVVAIDRARPRLELLGLQAILGTRARWVRVTPGELEQLWASYLPPQLPEPEEERLIDLLDGCLTRAQLPDLGRLLRLVTGRLATSLQAQGVVVYGYSARGLSADAAAFSNHLIGRRPELAPLHGRACPALDLAPDAGLAGRVAHSERLSEAQASELRENHDEPARWRQLGIVLEGRILAAPVVRDGRLFGVLQAVGVPGRGGSRLLIQVAERLGQLLSQRVLSDGEQAERIAARRGLLPAPRSWKRLDEELCRRVGIEALLRWQLVPLAEVRVGQLDVAGASALTSRDQDAFQLETGFWIRRERIVPRRSLRHVLKTLRQAKGPPPCGAIGVSLALRDVLALAGGRAVQDTDPVMIVGEPGTGKQQLARGIARLSAEPPGPFWAVGADALGKGELEQELFEALDSLEQAAGGSVFLEEVGALSERAQARLLDWLERPHRGHEPVRLFVATQRDLAAEVAADRFRADLLARLQSHPPLTLSPLRERPEDIPILVEHALATHAVRRGQAPRRLASSDRAEIMSRLTRHPWPGNLRELEQVVERLAEGEGEIALHQLEAFSGLARPVRALPAEPAGQAIFAEPVLRAIPVEPRRRATPVEPRLRAIPAEAPSLPRLPLLVSCGVPAPAADAFRQGVARRLHEIQQLTQSAAEGWVEAQLRHPRREWFTSEGWAALRAGVLVYLTVIGAAIAFWSHGG